MYGVRAGTSAGRFQRLGAGGVFVWDSGRTAWVCVHLPVSERADSLYGSAGIFLWGCGVCSFPDFKYRFFYSGNREPAADDGTGKRKAVCDIVDIAGLVKGASKGEGLGNQFLGNIRECDAIIHVLRCFDNGNIVHVDGSVDPVRDKEIIDTELQLKDLDTVENRIKRVEKIAKVGGDKMAKVEYELLLRYKDALEQGQSARTVIPQNDDEEQCAKQMFLLTTKPVLYVCNVDDTSAATGNQYVEQVREAIKDEDAQLIIISAQTEADIAELETYEEKQMFLEDLGLKESGCNRLIKAIYSLLNLETFITAGEMEVKAWTYRKGWKAPQCAGVIHTDFEKGFIRAEVIKYEDYIKYGSEAAVREAGKLGVEGKEYVVQDGDIMHFRFNV